MKRSLLVQTLLDMATGSDRAKLEELIVDAAGTFDAGSRKGYNPVTVPSGSVNVLGEKGVVSNNSVVVTPKAQVVKGWVNEGEISGTGVGVTASELVSGTLNVSSAGEVDVTNYQKISVNSGSAVASANKVAASNHIIQVTPVVTKTAGFITGGSENGSPVSVSAGELVSGTLNVTNDGVQDVTNYQNISVPSGGHSASAHKGAVSNHSITVTPRSTATRGFVQAGSVEGVGVAVSASELVNGSETYIENGVYDVTNLRSVQVNVPTESWILERTYTWSTDTDYNGTSVSIFTPAIPSNCTKIRLTFDGSVQCAGSGSLRLGLDVSGFGVNYPIILIQINTTGTTYPVIPVSQQVTSNCNPNISINVSYGNITNKEGFIACVSGAGNRSIPVNNPIQAMATGDSVTVIAGSTLKVEYMTM